MPKAKGLKILVVDDDKDLCDIIAESLEDEGFQVSKAFSGNQAVAFLAKNTVDLVLTDIKMPDGTGIDLLKNVVAGSPSAPVIVLMTGFADIAESELKAMGAKAVLRKPVALETFCRDLQSYVTKKAS